ncbi:MAG TPA: nuclear transport factor 2 family protein [Thermoanaerobaculia bacterium]
MQEQLMSKLTSVVVCLLCCLVLSFGQETSGEGAKVLTLEKKWTEAYRTRDISILSSLLAENFVITVEDGNTYGKAGYITHSADSSVHVEVAELSDLRVRTHGGVAVVTGAYHEKGQSKGKPYEYRDRLTDVWMNMAGRWQVIASHYSVPFSQ